MEDRHPGQPKRPFVSLPYRARLRVLSKFVELERTAHRLWAPELSSSPDIKGKRVRSIYVRETLSDLICDTSLWAWDKSYLKREAELALHSDS